MKKLLFCLSLLLLTACLPVDDFGPYWAKGGTDPALVGKWDEVRDAASGQGAGDPNALQVAVKDGTFVIDSLKEKDRQEKDYVPMNARTLTAAGYTFLMTLDEKQKIPGVFTGDLVRYKIEDGLFKGYTLQPKKMEEFLKANDPGETNIGRSPCAGKCLFDDVRIHRFDEGVYKILATIPDTPEFWTVDMTYRKRKDTDK